MEVNKKIIDRIKNYQERFDSSLTSNRKLKLFKDMCSYIKKVSPNFYDYEKKSISRNFYHVKN